MNDDRKSTTVVISRSIGRNYELWETRLERHPHMKFEVEITTVRVWPDRYQVAKSLGFTEEDRRLLKEKHGYKPPRHAQIEAEFDEMLDWVRAGFRKDPTTKSGWTEDSVKWVEPTEEQKRKMEHWAAPYTWKGKVEVCG